MNTIQPAAQNIYDFFTNKVLPDFGGDDLYIDVVSQIEGDRDQSREDAVALLGSKNTKAFGTFNEARNLMNLPPIEGGDIIPSSNVITPNDPENPDDGEISETEPIPVNPNDETDETGIFNTPVKHKDMTIKAQDKFEKQFDAMTRKIVGSISSKKKVKNVVKQAFTEEEIQRLQDQIERRGSVVKEEEEKIEKGMKRIFSAQRKEAIALFNLRFSNDFDSIKSIDRTKNVENDPYVNEESSIKRIVALLRSLIGLSVKKIGEEEFQLLHPISIPLVPDEFTITEKMASAILEYSQLSARGITVTTNTTIQGIIKRGLREGHGLEVIRRNIHDSFDYFERWRARRTAKTATFFASNMAGYEAMRQSKRVKTTKWYNPSPCQYCANYNGRVVEIGKTFAIKGESVYAEGDVAHLGSKIVVWRDVFFPPLHPNCECTLLSEEFYE